MVRKVAIISPSYDGKVVCDHALHLVTVFQRAAKERPDLQLSLNYWMYGAIIQQSRNNLFCDAYENGADDIFFMDVDQTVDAQAFFALLDHPVDVVGVTARMKTEDERYNHRPENDHEHQWDKDLKLLNVKYLPTGYMRISRKAAKKLYDSCPEYQDGGKKRKMICNVTIEKDGGIISEDIHLCKNLNELGLKCYLDIKYTCDHFGTKKFTGDYQQKYSYSVLSQLMEGHDDRKP